MSTEIPELRRCCCCLPLRSSLIAWGYFKLILDLLVLLYAILPPLINTTMFIYKWDMRSDDNIVSLATLTFIAVLVAADGFLHIIFIIGAHKKNVKLLRVYFYYSLTLLLLEYIFGIVYVGVVINSQWGDIRSFYIFIVTSDVTVFVSNLVIHAYVILLVRSEMVKLKDSSYFSFANDAAEADCILRFKDPFIDKVGHVDNVDTNIKDNCKDSGSTKVSGFDT